MNHPDAPTYPARPDPPSGGLSRLHLDAIHSLNDADILYLLNLGAYYKGLLMAGATLPQPLAGRTQINVFFENSTRTSSSFELAGKKLGADVLVLPIAHSSAQKGEELRDTIQTLAAMGADIMVVRHSQARIIRMMAECLGESGLPTSLINAGEGTKGHPTQALLDAATLLERFNRTPQQGLEGMTISIVGDIKHSRVAASNAELLTRLGATLRLAGPEAMLPDDDFYSEIERRTSLQSALEGADIIMALRIQLERMDSGPGMSNEDYFNQWGLTHERMAWANRGALIMHPGPINRNVELAGALADDKARSLILNQVAMGVPTRMAVLDAFTC